MRASGKPILVQSHYAYSEAEGLNILRKAGVPVFRSIEMAVECLAHAADYAEARRRLAGESIPLARVQSVDRLIEACRLADRDALPEHAAKELLGAYGVRVAQHVLAT